MRSTNAALKLEEGMPISVHGLNYKASPIEVREKFALLEKEYAPALKNILEEAGVEEAVVISTCNRLEFVTASRPGFAGPDRKSFASALEKISGVSSKVFLDQSYALSGSKAISHVFKVAAGLDSLVLGEPQILGQLKSAFRLAHQEGATSVYLNRLFQRAFGVAKTIRTNTGIGHHAVSVCYAAKELAHQIFGDLKEARVLLLGAGEMGALALQHFKSAGVSQLYIANKTLARATQLADRFQAIPLGLNKLSQILPEVDIVIGACALGRDDEQIVDFKQARETCKRRLGKTQFYIDLGVPRNFAEEISSLPDAFLYTVDDLEGVVRDNLGRRKLEIRRAELIVEGEVEKYRDWLSKRALEPTIKALRNRMLENQKVEVEKTLKRIKRSANTEQEIRQALEDMSLALIAKTLHQPITHLKQNAASDERLVALILDFFLGEE